MAFGEKGLHGNANAFDGGDDVDSGDGYHDVLPGVTTDDKEDMRRMGKTQELKVPYAKRFRSPIGLLTFTSAKLSVSVGPRIHRHHPGNMGSAHDGDQPGPGERWPRWSDMVLCVDLHRDEFCDCFAR